MNRFVRQQRASGKLPRCVRGELSTAALPGTRSPPPAPGKGKQGQNAGGSCCLRKTKPKRPFQAIKYKTIPLLAEKIPAAARGSFPAGRRAREREAAAGAAVPPGACSRRAIPAPVFRIPRGSEAERRAPTGAGQSAPRASLAAEGSREKLQSGKSNCWGNPSP